MKIATIRIHNLRIRTIIGFNPEERGEKQDVLVNMACEVEAGDAVSNDDPKGVMNYRTLKKRIMSAVEASRFFLLEKLADFILERVMEDSRILSATVRVDKPAALRFADSVSVEMSRARGPGGKRDGA